MGGEKIHKICGDGLQVELESNDCVLEVTGDGCRIIMAKNCGQVRVVGDGCHLKIAHNVGNIEYTGDGGQVQLGPKSSKENVRYIGDGGKVTFDSETSAKPHRASARNQYQRTRRQFESTMNNKSRGIPIDKQKQYSSNEENQNFLNERKEMEERRCKKNPTVKTSEHQCIIERKSGKDVSMTTKMITTLDCDSCQIVKKWFNNPGSLIKSFDGGCPEAARRKKINVDLV